VEVERAPTGLERRRGDEQALVVVDQVEDLRAGAVA
jgi:hypothetical protein